MSATFYIVGNGPTLTPKLLDKLPSNQWLGMNSAYRHWDKIGKYPKYYACLDPVVINAHAEEIARLIQKTPIEHFFLSDSILAQIPNLQNHTNITFLSEFLARTNLKVPMSQLALVKQTTGALATRFVIECGYTEICLLGIDCNYVEIIPESSADGGNRLVVSKPIRRNPNYYFDDYQLEGDAYQIPNPASHGGNLHLQSFIALKNDLDKIDIGVRINVGSIESLLGRFCIFPIVCPYQLLKLRRLACVAVPLTVGEIDTFIKNVNLWRLPQFSPSLHIRKKGTVLHIFMDTGPNLEITAKVASLVAGNEFLDNYFDNIYLTYLDLPPSVNYYEKSTVDSTHYCTKSGPNISFLAAMANCKDYAYTLQMEADCIPVRAGWLDAADLECASAYTDFWISGPEYGGPSTLASRYRLHINGNAIYKTGSHAFQEFLKTTFINSLKNIIGSGVRDLAYDTCISFSITNPISFVDDDYYRMLHAFGKCKYSNLIRNFGGGSETRNPAIVDYGAVWKENPECFLLHGRSPLEYVHREKNKFPLYYSDSDFVQQLGILSFWSPDTGISFIQNESDSVHIASEDVSDSIDVIVHFYRIRSSSEGSSRIEFSMASPQSDIEVTEVRIIYFDLNKSVQASHLLESFLFDSDGNFSFECSFAKLSSACELIAVAIKFNLKEYRNALILNEIRCWELSSNEFTENPSSVPFSIVPSNDDSLHTIENWVDFINDVDTVQKKFIVEVTSFRSNYANFQGTNSDSESATFSILLKKDIVIFKQDDYFCEISIKILSGWLFAKPKLNVNVAVSGCLSKNISFGMRFCRGGSTAWEYKDFNIKCDDQGVGSFELMHGFKEDHSEIRIEIHSLSSIAKGALIALTVSDPDVKMSKKRDNAPNALIPISSLLSQKVLPRVLIIDETLLGGNFATGQLKATYFTDWSAEEWMQVGSEANDVDKFTIIESSVIDRLVNVNDVLRRCSLFKPDIIYFRPTPNHKIFEIFDNLLKNNGTSNIPFVIHMMDDWPSKIANEDPVKFAYFDIKLRSIIALSALRFSISEAMSKEYSVRYGVNWIPLANAVDSNFYFKHSNSCEFTDVRPMRIRYMGGLAKDMTSETVYQISAAVERLSASFPIVLDVYTMDWYKEEFLGLTSDFRSTQVHSLVDLVDYPVYLRNADALLIAYNFDSTSLDYVGFSMANKLPEYLATGRPIIGVGPECLPSISYLKSLNHCVVLETENSEKAIDRAIKYLYLNYEKLRNLQYLRRDIAVANHDKEVVLSMFKRRLCELMHADDNGGLVNSPVKYDISLSSANGLIRQRKFSEAIDILKSLYSKIPLEIYKSNIDYCRKHLAII